MHEEKLDVLEVADKESLVAGGGQELGLLVGTIADLKSKSLATCPTSKHADHQRIFELSGSRSRVCTYLGHGNGTAESSSDSGIDTLGLAPARVHALEPITLVTGEALRACTHTSQHPCSQENSIAGLQCRRRASSRPVGAAGGIVRCCAGKCTYASSRWGRAAWRKPSGREGQYF